MASRLYSYTDGTTASGTNVQGEFDNVYSSFGVPVFGRVVRTAGDVTTTSTTLVDFTGATVTLTTGAFPVLVGVVQVASVNAVTEALIAFNIDIDGALQLGTVGTRAHNIATADRFLNRSFTYQSAALTAASHTIKLQWSTANNTATVEASSAESHAFWVSEIR